MPARAKDTYQQMGWLMVQLLGKRDHIAALLLRITGLGPANQLKPSLFNKFLHMLDEVAVANNEEKCLLGRIEQVEHTHRLLRRHKKLRKVRCGVKAAHSNGLATERPEENPNRSQSGVFKIIVFWWLISGCKRNQKSQRLTVD